jgi:upstream activation factor subunit UAF30
VGATSACSFRASGAARPRKRCVASALYRGKIRPEDEKTLARLHGHWHSLHAEFILKTAFPTIGADSANHRESNMAKAKKGKASKKKVSKAKKPAKKKSARKPNAAFMKPMNPSSTLAAVIGGSPMPRTEVTKKLWGYIKRNGLQDKSNRRMINADDKLKPVFGGRSQVSMFEMTKLVSNHLK